MLTLNEAAPAVQGDVRGPNAEFRGVTTDSRAVAAGDLFIALRGEKFDGHQFVRAALTQGAAAAVVDRLGAAELPQELPLLVVEDTRQALGDLAAFWRSRFSIPLAAITGSNGKTTVKEMLAAILREVCERSGVSDAQAGVLATQGNLNNDIGMPITLLKLRSVHRFAVIEMGMNHPGEISYLTGIARPLAALVNNAQPAHLAGLGSVEAVARAKGEIFEGLGANGIAVINADDAHASLWRELAAPHRIIDFGLEQPAAVSASYVLQSAGVELHVKLPGGGFDVVLRVPGVHNARNALAATALAVALGVPPDAIGAGLARFAGVKGRQQRKAGLNGSTLIDDTYNANPASVAAAIAVLAAAPDKRVLVLGDMGELGEEAAALHAQIGTQAKQAGIDLLFGLGTLSKEAVRTFGQGARHFERLEDLEAQLEVLLRPDVTVLVKGSRFMQMERVVKRFEC